MIDFENFQREQHLFTRRQETFGNATSLYHCRFEQDNGCVPQMEQARQYVQHWSKMRENNLGLLFWGQPGNGKTFAAACIANALVESKDSFPPDVKMTTFGTILNRLPALSAADKEYYLEQFQKCDLLILDDFGMERQTDYAREQVFNIIDGRYLTKRPLIVTTNLSLAHMKTTTDLAEKRIYDRVLEMCIPVFFSGESQRPDRAKANLEQFRSIVGK